MAGTGVGIPGADFGHISIDSGTVTPFSAAAMDEDAGTVVVHFKVLSENAEERRLTAGAIQEALANARVGRGKGIAAIITDANTEATTADTHAIAALVVPEVLKRLGIRA